NVDFNFISLADVPIGGICVSNIQCRGSNYSGVCWNLRCTCRAGCTAIQNSCYPNAEKVTLGGFCHWKWQCTGTFNADVCKDNRCTCKSGFISHNQRCFQADVPIGGLCVSDIQCRDANYSAVCLKWKCTCREGYTAIQNSCFEGSVAFGGFCHWNKQCTGSLYADVCKNNSCVCKSGYISYNQTCYQGNVAIGGFCHWNEQCTGSLHADVCKNNSCVCKSGYISYNQTCYQELNFDNVCFSWNQTCKDLTRECSILRNQNVGICVCKLEYLGFGAICLEGNLKINQSCERNEQCTATQDLECQNGTCMCRDWHVPVNETYCIPVKINGKEAGKMFLNREQANGLGATIGSVFGGFFLGVVFSALIAYLISRRYKTSMPKRDETSIKFDRHSAHIAPMSESNRTQSAKNTEQTYKRKIVNVPPYSPSMESPTYSNVKEAKTSQMKEDDVYNHLHEKEDEETENVYNQASCSSGQTTEDDYGHLNAGRSNEGVVLPEDDVYAHTEAANNDNYFVLENQSQI
ncbi:tenascin-like, partial [Saccostrea cucullata]|uniref:tenascin-like n=1 Tax=Saccostrea cuccullata TaxID=36930 RepID=UPI002ED38DD3